MANTYTQLYIHFVFAVKYRKALIHPGFREEVEKYMTGLIQNKGHKLLAIYLMPDHAHILISFNPKYSISETVSILKRETSNFINDKKFLNCKFHWQTGFGAFSNSLKELLRVIDYILNQPSHHKKRAFKKEYLALLKRYEIEYKDEYLFDFFAE